MRIGPAILAAVFAVALLPMSAGAQPLVIAPEGQPVEDWPNAPRIAAPRVIVGLSLEAPAARTRPSVHAVMPAAWAGQRICARWLSLDALYTAHNTYVVPEGGLARLEHPTAYADRLRDIGPAELGLTVSRGDCDAPETEFAPALWNADPDLSGGQIAITLNSAAADQALLVIRDAAAETVIACTRIDGLATQGADFRCLVPIGERAGPRALELVRIRRGQPMEPVRFAIVMDGAP